MGLLVSIIHYIKMMMYFSEIYLRSLSWKKASTLSVFHLSIPSSSTMTLFSSISFMMGSAPRTYLMAKPGNCLGRSLLTNAWTCGNLPNFHPHTCSSAYGYVFNDSSPSESLEQHF
uniref:Uncharacterized protein n=1 Tax=Pinctada fucata TaxID=50426 RepID=A0A194AKW2_PINFU